MLISHKHKFIFLHVQSTGGTSMSAALEPFCEHTLQEHNRLGFPSHATAAQARQLVGADVWNSYFKFAFERNPWDRTLSGYHYQLKHVERYRRFYWPPKPTFDQWMFPLGFVPKKLKPSSAMYSIGGRSAVDFLGRYETLVDDFTTVCRQIGLGEIPLPRRNRSRQSNLHDYRPAYTPRAQRRVASVFHREIEQLGYAF